MAYYSGITDKGKRRENNEDSFIATEIAGGSLFLACVIDGVGGYKGGEVAAAIARATILEKMKDVSGDITGKLEQAVIAANEKIQAERNDNEKYAAMACVLTCAVVDKRNNKLYYAHVGDTRLYLLRDASLVKITKDHSAIGFLEETGRLSEDDAMRHPRRNEINRALGFEPAISEADYIETGESPFLPGDTISSSAITTILNSNQNISARAQDLVNAANEAGGNDNITAVIVENNKPPKKQVALKPVEKKLSNGSSAAPQQKITVEERPTNKNNKGLMISLVVISALLGIAATFLLFQQRAVSKNISTAAAAVIKHPDRLTLALTAAVNDTSKIYTLPAGSTLMISEPIIIGKDSFILKGNGSVLKADSGYHGPAFIISNTAKLIVLDSLVFENFDAALFLQKNNIQLKNLRFANCSIAAQYGLTVKDSSITGRFHDSIFIHSQSLKKQ
jgi:PPM family protein phosphatase